MPALCETYNQAFEEVKYYICAEGSSSFDASSLLNFYLSLA